MATVEGVARRSGCTVAVIQSDCDRTFAGPADKCRVEFGNVCIQGTVGVALIEVAIDIAELPPVILLVGVAEFTLFRMESAPFGSVVVNGLVIDGFIATPQVNGICCRDDALRVLLQNLYLGGVL